MTINGQDIPQENQASSTQMEEVDMMWILSDEVTQEVETVLDTPQKGFTMDEWFPNFISIWDDGFYIHLDLLSWPQEFAPFIDHFFAWGYYIENIDYASFQSLYYDYDFYQSHKGSAIRLGSWVAILQEQRVLRLYKNLLASKNEVSFLFDKFIFLEDEDNLWNYSFDEMLVVLWAQWIKSGLNETEIKSAITSTETQKIVIARDTPPQPWQDAQIVQVYEYVEKDFAPVEVNGITDFTTAYNNMPQINQWVQIFKKIPIKHGKDGRYLYGEKIPQPMLKDIDLHKKRGEWTSIISGDFWEEFLVSDMKGFIDLKLWKVSVTKNRKPHRGNIDGKTLNITIEPDNWDFTLIGNISNEYELRWNDLHITGDIDGKAISNGGMIKVKWTVSGWKDRKGNPTGYVYNTNWDIEFLSGVCNNAILLSPNWKVDLSKATSISSWRIAGKDVIISSAVNAVIIWDNITITSAQHCTIIGRNITIGNLGSKSWENNIYLVQAGDKEVLEKEIAHLEKEILEKTQITVAKKQELDRLKIGFAPLKLPYDNKTELLNAVKKNLNYAMSLQQKMKNPAMARTMSQEDIAKNMKSINAALHLRNLWMLYEEVPQLTQEVSQLRAQKSQKQSELDTVLISYPTANIKSVSGDTNVFSIILKLDEHVLMQSKDTILENLLHVNCITRIDESSEGYQKPYTFSK